MRLPDGAPTARAGGCSVALSSRFLTRVIPPYSVFPRAADCVARRSSELTMAYPQCTTSDLWLVRFMATLRETQRTQLAPAVSIEHDEP